MSRICILQRIKYTIGNNIGQAKHDPGIQFSVDDIYVQLYRVNKCKLELFDILRYIVCIFVYTCIARCGNSYDFYFGIRNFLGRDQNETFNLLVNKLDRSRNICTGKQRRDSAALSSRTASLPLLNLEFPLLSLIPKNSHSISEPNVG